VPTVSFHLKRNSPLLERLRNEDNASATIRRALQEWYEGAEDDRLGAIEERLGRIERKLSAGVVVPEKRSDGDEVDASAIDEALREW
jgi:transcription elongation GreA/GreB family factor